ncbi:MAG TPA: adenylate/guanylate cyclase domain-containing protein [Stellaceae bacterium]|nr:adenylate/guanylate cyclase domain-containing protein [Stellaceae bacterium]
MSDLRAWLLAHKFEQYADTFEANDIDFDVLSELSEADLAGLGMSLGNRRRMMRAIAARVAADPTVPQQVATAGPGARAPAEAERRQVTVLFADLVGSTELSRTIDPELLGALIRRYQNAAAGAVGRFGGFVAKFMGDGVLAYFGFPRAFEDAAERTVRAALALIAEVRGICRPDGEPLRVRIGIATGLVVVGEIIGTGAAQEHSIVGETPNLAARLQALASPDTVLVSEQTRQLLAGLFELEALGEHPLKGFARPVPVWRVTCEAAAESRFAAIRAQSKLPLIGRAHEMGLLLDRWRLARQGEGQIVTVIGEAGIGKSRSIEALQDALVGEPHARIHLQCSPYHSDSALYPVLQHLARAARFATADQPSTRLEKLAALFAHRPASDAAFSLLAQLMSISIGDTPSQTLTPAQREAAVIGFLVDEIVRLGADNPVLLLLEDAQWIDATMLDLMTRLADRIGAARLLAVVTARPDFAPPWLARPHAMLLTLGRLGRAECAELIAGVAAAHGLSSETVAAIVAKTDGVPLFAEELTKTVLESGMTGPDPGRADRSTLSAIPSTLQDSLMARLDRLGEAREVAQIAAVIGREFAFALLDAVVPDRSAEIEAGLSKLVAAGIVFPQGHGDNREYSFKHALVRDAAYESLLLSRRRYWHERIGAALEERFPDIAVEEPELLARHFAQAGLAVRACGYRERAGDRAGSRSAYREAIAHYSVGLQLAEELADENERRRRQLALLLKLGPAFTTVTGAQSTEVENTYRRAAEIGMALHDAVATYKAKWGLWLSANLARKTALARDQANELVTLAQHSGDGDLLLEAHHCRWSTAFFRGEVAAARDFGRMGVESYDMARHRHLGPAFGGHDPGVCAHIIIGLASSLAGEMPVARQEAEKGIALGEALDHPYSLVHAIYNAAMVHQIGGDRELTGQMAERALALTDKYGFPPYRAGAILLLAWACGAERAESAELLDQEIARAAAAGPGVQYLLGLAGEVMLGTGSCERAMALFDRALASNQEPEVGFYLAEIWRQRGTCLLTLGRANTAEARQAFLTARAIARQQGATVFESRAAAALAEISKI